ncbi:MULTISPECIES: NETI motif-containing protein [Pontibacillus]|uniref:NETI motif-containing protein n=1 Tax=Pontibacillus chungwhensis TaxID=265426 RepID=A0ABY8V1G5_9BACI|nr:MULTISPECIES: NETI motif-containing protein [Pontibacillus]MCD5325336.1 NETI motif-containing protein [Pontibacillus sp. HN14]WIF98454.1 NETI motif-containing protein [Pontibacillus chungwhensis]
MGKQKKRFIVEDGDSIDSVLDTMKEEGYMPIRRVEEPIFQERVENGEKKVEPIGSKIIFDAVKTN